jgi:4'-phosphopantetheinyl transferase
MITSSTCFHPPLVEYREISYSEMRPLVLAEGTVDLWLLSRSNLCPHWDSLTALLSPDEQSRRDRFIQAEHRKRFALFHGALRQILGHYVGESPEDLRFERGPKGKPTLAGLSTGKNLMFNLSHSRDVMVLACAQAGSVGVDVEWIDAKTDVDGLSARFFHPNERAVLAGLDPVTRSIRFFQWWTAKEALLKAQGEGLSDGLQAFDFSAWTGAAFVNVKTSGFAGLGWRLGVQDAAIITLMVDPAPKRITLRTGLGGGFHSAENTISLPR